MDKLDPDDVRPPYQQVAARLREAIRLGEFPVGSKLPGHSAIADTYGVSVGTVKRAYGLLQRDKLIVTRQGSGSFVRSTDPAQSDGDLDDVRVGLAELAKRVTAIEARLGAPSADD